MEVVNQSVLLLALAILLASGVERILEIVRSVQDYLAARRQDYSRWNTRAESLRDLVESRLDNAKSGTGGRFGLQLLTVSKYLSPVPSSEGGLIAVSADTLRKMTLKLSYKIIAIIVGIVLAALFGINMFDLVRASLPQTGQAGNFLVPGWLGVALTGVSIGLGAGPMHKIITALERARDARR